MKIFLCAVVLMLAIEGSLLAAFPEFMRQRFEEGGRVPAPLLRKIGIFGLVLALSLGLALKSGL